MADFSASLLRETINISNDIDLTVRTVVFKFAARLVERSPVGNDDLWKTKAPKGYVGGHFRAQWQHGYNNPPSDELPLVDPTGVDTTKKLKQSVFNSPVAGVHWIVNMAPYAQRLEDGDHSTQAPSGIVSLTILDFNNLLDTSIPT